jgi:predicted permease
MLRLYRALLHLYPASFRIDYGEEMADVFASRVAGARGLTALGMLGRESIGVIREALALHGTMLAQDLRQTARSLHHARGFALTALLVTALGVGANTAALSVADFVLFRPLPFPDPESLVRICEGPREGGGWGCMNELSPANYRDFKTRNTTLRGMAGYIGRAVNLVGEGEPERISATAVTPDLLPLLGVAPRLGRLFDPATGAGEDQNTVIVSHGLWQSRFGGSPGVLGQTLTLDGSPHVIIGVMPPDFHFPSRDVRLWTPLQLNQRDFDNRDNSFLQGLGRLKPGVSFEQARADLVRISEVLGRDFPETNAETGVSFWRMKDEFSPRTRAMVIALSAAGLCMLVLTCANLASLLLARAAARERELAVRAALGAGRERLTRQLITESAVLALAGGALGILVAVVSLPLVAHVVPTSLPIAAAPTLDWRMLALALSVTGLTGLGFGLVPALRAGRAGFSGLREGARSGGGRKQRLRSTFVVIEVAVSVVLLISFGLLVRAVWRIQAVDPGFRAEHVLTLRTELPRSRYDTPERRNRFYSRVVAGVRVLPGVESAAYVSGLPMVLTGGIWGVLLPGREKPDEERYLVGLRFVTPDYFTTLRIPLTGRDIEDGDLPERLHVAVVSRSFATRFLGGQDPIGTTIRVGDRTLTPFSQPVTVVGVAEDVRVRGLERTNEPQLYLSAWQAPDSLGMLYDPKDLAIRFSGEPGPLLAQVRDIIRAADPTQPISNVRMMDDVVAGETATRRAQLRVLGALAAIALLLTGVGIHGLLAYIVAQRSQEIGIRLALGAAPRGVAAMVLRDGMRLALLGIVPGVFGAWAVGRTLRALLFGVDPSDPATIGVAVGLAALMAFAGSLLPALLAVRVNPMTVMRAE